MSGYPFMHKARELGMPYRDLLVLTEYRRTHPHTALRLPLLEKWIQDTLRERAPPEQITGSVMSMTARIECGGCGSVFEVDLDSPVLPVGDLHQYAIGAVSDGMSHSSKTSVQGGHLLCRTCTRIVDNYVDEHADDPDRSATADEVARALDEEQRRQTGRSEE